MATRVPHQQHAATQTQSPSCCAAVLRQLRMVQEDLLRTRRELRVAEEELFQTQCGRRAPRTSRTVASSAATQTADADWSSSPLPSANVEMACKEEIVDHSTSPSPQLEVCEVDMKQGWTLDGSPPPPFQTHSEKTSASFACLVEKCETDEEVNVVGSDGECSEGFEVAAPQESAEPCPRLPRWLSLDTSDAPGAEDSDVDVDEDMKEAIVISNSLWTQSEGDTGLAPDPTASLPGAGEDGEPGLASNVPNGRHHPLGPRERLARWASRGGRNMVRCCWQCSEPFNSYAQLEKHTISEHPGTGAHPCLWCSKAFSTFAQLKRHNQLVHLKLRPFACKKCGQRFSQKRNQLLHEARSSCGRPRVRRPPRQQGSGPASNVDTALQHEGHTEEATLLACGTSAAQRPQHAPATHHCPRCSEAFSSVHKAKQHLCKTLTKDGPYWCGICDKLFAKYPNFHSHLRSHKAPLTCLICHSVYTKLGFFRRHLLRGHAAPGGGDQ